MLRGSSLATRSKPRPPHTASGCRKPSIWRPEVAYLLKRAKYPTPESRPRLREALIESYRKGKIAEVTAETVDAKLASAAIGLDIIRQKTADAGVSMNELIELLVIQGYPRVAEALIGLPSKRGLTTAAG